MATVTCGGAGSSQTGVVGRVHLAPFQVPRLLTIDRIIYRILTQGGASTTVRLGIYPSSLSIPDNQTVLLDAGTFAADAGTGFFERTIADTQLTQGLWFVALETEDTTIVLSRYTTGARTGITAKSWGCYYARVGGYGALTTPCPATTDGALTL